MLPSEYRKLHPKPDWKQFKEEEMSRQSAFKTVATVRSENKSDKFYTLKTTPEGHITCNCPAWIFNQRRDTPRTCKHTDKFENNSDNLQKMLALSGSYDILIDGTKWIVEKKEDK